MGVVAMPVNVVTHIKGVVALPTHIPYIPYLYKTYHGCCGYARVHLFVPSLRKHTVSIVAHIIGIAAKCNMWGQYGMGSGMNVN
jgi:hypothetical protein